MKQLTKFVFAVLLSLTAIPTFAGRYVAGSVTVNDYAVPGQTYVAADYNVRYNASARSTSFIGVAASSYLISFNAADSIVNKNFYCQVTPSSPIFSDAYDIAKNLRNGSSVIVYKNNTTSECISVQMSNYSYKTD